MSTHARQALISRPLDFWLLGGLSLLTLSLLMIVRQLDLGLLRHPGLWLTVGLYLRVGLEYPHLLATYKLSYSRGREFIRSHWFVMLLAPVALLATGGFIIATLDFNLLPASARAPATWILTGGVHALFLGFGWHRLRQVWGCMSLYSRYDGVRLTTRQRASIHAFLFSMWIFGYLHMISSTLRFDFFGVTVKGIAVPSILLTTAASLFAASGAFFLFENVFVALFKRKRLPSLCFFVPIVALLFWWAALSLEPAFFFFLAPSFHSLQYLAVVWAYERGPTSRELPWPSLAMLAATLLGLFALGYSWETVPSALLPKGSAAIAIAYMVVSLHHYLLDGVIWRTSDPRIKNLLE